MVGDAGDDVAQVSLRIEVIEDRGLGDGVDQGGATTAPVGAGEQVILPAEGDLGVILPMSGRKLSFTTVGILCMARLCAWSRSSCARQAVSSMS